MIIAKVLLLGVYKKKKKLLPIHNIVICYGHKMTRIYAQKLDGIFDTDQISWKIIYDRD